MRQIVTHRQQTEDGDNYRTTVCPGICFRHSLEAMALEECEHYTVRMPEPDWVAPMITQEYCRREI